MPKGNENRPALCRILGNLTQIFRSTQVAGRRPSTHPTHPSHPGSEGSTLGSFHLALAGPFLLHVLQFPALESAVFKRERSGVSAISGHSHLVKMIRAGLSLLPEPGKHEISPVQISQAEVSPSLPHPLRYTYFFTKSGHLNLLPK